MKTCTVLRADDSDDDNLLLKRACRKSAEAFNLLVVNDGQKAIDYLQGTGTYGDREQFPVPALLLLDLKMPRKSGFEVLEWIRQQEPLKDLPVAIFTSSQNASDIQRAYEKGATWYLMKPVDYEELCRVMTLVAESVHAPAANHLANSAFYRAPKPTV